MENGVSLLTGKSFEAAAMVLSLATLCLSYLIVVWKDRSWINWLTPVFFFSLGGRYVFQFAYLCLVNPGGSRYAYFICYTAYALPLFLGVLVYAFVKPLKIKSTLAQVGDVGLWPWFLLLLGFCFYLPILIQFREYLSQPRRIYELTRTGYGFWSYGSTTLVNLSLIVYLFKRNKHTGETACFYAFVGSLTYLHGSKGLLVNCFLIWMLYRVYVERKTIKAFAAAGLLSMAGILVVTSFAFFSNTADLAELFEDIIGFADYVRLAMSIVDDPHGKVYYGRLNLENEVYGRIPRAILPGKPKDFGPFLLAKIYNPANYRNDEGTGAVDFGEDYADFGPYAVLARSVTSVLMGWMISIAVVHLRGRRSPSAFIVFIYLAGASVVPISGLFLLPEYTLLGIAVTIALRLRLGISLPTSYRSKTA